MYERYCFHDGCLNNATHEVWENEDDYISVCEHHIKDHLRKGETIREIDGV